MGAGAYACGLAEGRQTKHDPLLDPLCSRKAVSGASLPSETLSKERTFRVCVDMHIRTHLLSGFRDGPSVQ